MADRKKIAIFGAGGFGQEITCVWMEMLRHKNIEFDFIGYFDDGKVVQKLQYGNVIGNRKDLDQYPESLEVCFALGNPHTLASVINDISNPRLVYPNISHPSLQQLDSEHSQMGKGNIISVNVILSNKIKIGDFNIFNTRATLGHDVVVGNYNIFSPNVQISGEVIIGNKNLFGFNSGIIQCKKVGDENILGAGSILLRNIENGNTYVGNPAVKLKF